MVEAIGQCLVDVARGVFSTMLDQLAEPMPDEPATGKQGGIHLKGHQRINRARLQRLALHPAVLRGDRIPIEPKDTPVHS